MNNSKACLMIAILIWPLAIKAVIGNSTPKNNAIAKSSLDDTKLRSLFKRILMLPPEVQQNIYKFTTHNTPKNQHVVSKELNDAISSHQTFTTACRMNPDVGCVSVVELAENLSCYYQTYGFYTALKEGYCDTNVWFLEKDRDSKNLRCTSFILTSNCIKETGFEPFIKNDFTLPDGVTHDNLKYFTLLPSENLYLCQKKGAELNLYKLDTTNRSTLACTFTKGLTPSPQPWRIDAIAHHPSKDRVKLYITDMRTQTQTTEILDIKKTEEGYTFSPALMENLGQLFHHLSVCKKLPEETIKEILSYQEPSKYNYFKLFFGNLMQWPMQGLSTSLLKEARSMYLSFLSATLKHFKTLPSSL